MIKEELEISRTSSKKSLKAKFSPEAREIMAIFYRRNKLLNYKRKDFWAASEILNKVYGVEAVILRLEQLDKMTEFIPVIINPSDLRDKWYKIKVPEIVKSNFKEI